MPKLSEKKFNDIVNRVTELREPIMGWFPTEKDAEILCRDMEKNFEFLLWIVDSNPNMSLTDVQKQTRKYIRDKINASITFVD